MEFKLWTGKPQFHDFAFHEHREMANHIEQPAHRERILEAADLIEKVYRREFGRSSASLTLADYGAGNGGMLKLLEERLPEMQSWGYDLQPSNVAHAKDVLNVHVSLVDVTDQEAAIPGGIVALTEILEHLIDPHELLERLYEERRVQQRVQYIVASSPAAESPDNHYEFHNWAWTGDSYAKMFERAGWLVQRSFVRADLVGGTQFLVASR